MYFKDKSGFTLIEVLVVVVIIGVLAGVLLNVINVSRQKDIANDAVRVSTMEKLAQALESYVVSNGRTPVDTNSDFNPISAGDADAAELGRFITAWPTTNVAGQNYTYFRSSTTAYCVGVPMSAASTTYYKYIEPNSVSNVACKGKILKGCTNQCTSGGSGLSVTGCTTLENVSCS